MVKGSYCLLLTLASAVNASICGPSLAQTLTTDSYTRQIPKPPEQDTGFNIGSNNVSGHVKVDADEFSLPTVRTDTPLHELRTGRASGPLDDFQASQSTVVPSFLRLDLSLENYDLYD